MTYGGGTGRSGGTNAARFVGVGVAVILTSLLATPVSSAQTTQPALDPYINRWFHELSDPYPSVRDQARVALLGLRVEQLGELRRVVEASRPVSPAQAAVLHDIVLHVYIAAQRVDIHPQPSPYDREIQVTLGPETRRFPGVPRTGFLGVLLEPIYDRRRRLPEEEEEIPPRFTERKSLGVMIKETWPGFAGFRYLHVGDVVVGTGRTPILPRNEPAATTQPGEDVLQPSVRPDVPDVKNAVSATVPERTLVLQVIRLGRVVDVPVRVTARPPWAPSGPNDEPMMRAIQYQLFRRAERYWDTAFRPLVLGDDDHSVS